MEKLSPEEGGGVNPRMEAAEPKQAFAPEGRISPNSPGIISLPAASAPAETLTVRVFSFSFHRDMPADEAGHGGGFVFDARGLPNPGREEQFRALTGKDAAVIDYLNREASVREFLAGVLALVDASVSEYQRRGFKNLMVSFGCTGGQHRSVYLAEQLARHLRANGVEVVVRHIELEKAEPDKMEPEKMSR
jgi:RNase adaptor protein for sRNA GlmZ degradation